MGLEIQQHDRKKRRWSSTPVFWRDVFMVTTGSLLLHGLVLLIVSLIPPEKPPWQKKELAITTEFDTKPEIEILTPIEADLPELNLHNEIKVDAVIPEMKPIQTESLIDVDTNESLEMPAEDDLKALADLSGALKESEGTGLEALALNGLELNSTAGSVPNTYQGRTSTVEKKKRAKVYGADPKVLDAVEKSLNWLVEHQNANGSWPIFNEFSGNATKKNSKAPAENQKVDKPNAADENAKQTPTKESNKDYIDAVTASALLAFLGAGHTEMSGQHKDTVRKGIRYLNDEVLSRAKHPLFGGNYGSALMLMALSESSIFGSTPRTKQNANALAKMFIDEYNGEGWSYTGAGDDFSVSGWVALGLKSARYAELPDFPEESMKKLFQSYGKWVNTMTHPDTGKGNYRNNQEGSLAMSFVGMFQKQFLGFPPNDPFLLSAAQLGVANLNQQFDVEKMTWNNEYAIYYGTLAAFQQQGAFWKKWNPMMQKTLLGTQNEGSPKELGGSWDPGSGFIGKSGGRVMSTAILTLCLEVYYRYEMMH